MQTQSICEASNDSGWSSYLSKALELSKPELEVVYGVVPYASLFTYYSFAIGLTSTFDQLTSSEKHMLLTTYKLNKIY